jgi:hypothetical protein
MDENTAQCPNCGGYKVNTDIREFLIENGKEVTRKAHPGGIILGIILLVLGIATLGFAIGIILVPVGILIIWLSSRTNHHRKIFKIYEYYCSICGYKWSRKENDPFPEVNVRPDLISKGVKKLEEDQAMAAKIQQDAAAAHYLKQQKGK